jgi:hypothetical protein
VPLSAVNFVNKGPVLHNDLLQFYNLFTGTMVDQPVTFRNTLVVGGNQGSTTVPLRIYGAVGQTGDLLDLYVDPSHAQASFGFGASGNFAWGPGGVAPQDTFLTRIAMQNGHASDTAGLLITPRLEVSGVLQALQYTYLNQTTISSPSPFAVEINQDLSVDRYLSVGKNAAVGQAAVSWQALNVSGQSLSASSGYAIGAQIGPSMVATANNDGLINLWLTGSFNAATHTGVTQYGMLVTPTWTNAGFDAYGIYVGQIATGNTNNIGVLIAQPTGASQLNVPLRILTNTGSLSMLLSGNVSNQYGLGINAAELTLCTGGSAAIGMREANVNGTLGFNFTPGTGVLQLFGNNAEILFVTQTTAPKISLYNAGAAGFYGFGIGSGELYVAIPTTSGFVVRGAGSPSGANAFAVYPSSTGPGSSISFFGHAGAVQQTATGSKAGNAALATVVAILASMGLLVDGTT